MLRMDLYHEEYGDLVEGTEGYDSALEKANSDELLGCWNSMPHRGCWGPKRSGLEIGQFSRKLPTQQAQRYSRAA
jgi:hypothetical protein